MAQERKSSVGTQGTLRDILTVLEKKIRNLEKRKSRLEQVEKDIEQGKEVVETQRIALSKKDQVLDMLEVCRDFLQTAEQLAKNDETVAKAKAKKEQKEANQKIIDTLGNVLRLQFLLGEALRREEFGDNNQTLEALRASVEEAGAKDFGKAAELWVNVLEAKPKEFAPGVTFEAVHTKLSSMGELLAKLNDVSACTETSHDTTATKDDQHAAGLDDPALAVEGHGPMVKTGEITDNGVPSEENASTMSPPAAAHSVDQQPPLEQVDPLHVQQQLHEPPMVSGHHTAAPVHHHHPAAILLKGKKGGEDMFCTVAFYSHTPIDDYRYLLPHRELVPPPLPQVISPQPGHGPAHPGQAAHHPGNVVTVVSGVVPVSPVQQLDEEAGDPIQFGSVENPLAVQQQQQHLNGTPFCAGDRAAAPPDPESLFEDREFDFFQDDLLHPAPPAAVAVAPAAAAAVPAVAAPPMMLHPDPAVVHVQTGTSAGTPSLVPTHASFNAHYQQLIQMQPHLGPQQLQAHHQQLANKAGLQQQHHHQQQPQQQQQTGHEADDSQMQKQKADSHHQGGQMGGPHQQGMHGGPNNGHHHHHRHERRSPRDNARGDHEGQAPPHKNSYYRSMNGGGPNHGKGHYGESAARNNWSDGRRGENNNNGSNTSRGNNTWNNRNDRPAYNNGPRHHGNGGGGGGYGNRSGGAVMGRREQTAQRV